ncbi:hypothetical protein OIU78_021914 [Salix suchowensis]|nr:hypothetical protein OIU78_021914 [Salix suchowensis]
MRIVFAAWNCFRGVFWENCNSFLKFFIYFGNLLK